MNEIEEGVKSLNKDVEDMRTFVKLVDVDAKHEFERLRDELLYLEVYNSRENLRFYGLPEKTDGKEDSEED